MPMSNMVHMFGGTKKKSSLVDERVIAFPRDDEGSPRQLILEKSCKPEVTAFRGCLKENDFDENKCPTQKAALDLISKTETGRGL